jgi:hypothetical protein
MSRWYDRKWLPGSVAWEDDWIINSCTSIEEPGILSVKASEELLLEVPNNED